MSERKVLNKYYPPDFDPSKIPRMKLARNRQYTVRLMAPFNMRCKTCGEYIYKGKKFNARKEDVEGDDYLGIRIYRFYIKCTRCLQEISFKTDPRNTDYEIEAGATRNFMALKLAEEQAQREEDEEKEEEATNPMKLLEKRTQQSKQELALLESLEELKDLNRRQQTIDYDQMLEQFDTEAARQRTIKEQEEYDEQYVKSIFKKKQLVGTVVEEQIIELGEDGEPCEPPKKLRKKSINEAEEENSKACDVQVKKDVDETEDVKSLTSSGIVSWTDTSKPTSNREYLHNIIKRKTNLGVKVNSVSAQTKSTIVSNASVTQHSNEKMTKDDSLEVKPSGLSLLGAYSGSSDNDSD